MEFKYPTTDLERSEALLRLLGGFWNNIWGSDEAGGGAFIVSMQNAMQSLALQTDQDTQELQDTGSRFKVPVLHLDNWYQLTITESEVNDEQTSLAKYDGEFQYNTSGVKYDEPVARPFFNWPTPSDLQDIPVITNRITFPSVSLTPTIDYVHDPELNVITFRENPFNDPLIPKRNVFNDRGIIVDREAALWVFHAGRDRDMVYDNWAYVIALRLRSSEAYRKFVNAIFDGLVRGTSQREIQFGFAAVTGTPLVVEVEETVEIVVHDGDNLVIVTDHTVYRYPNNATAIVAPGDVVYAGDPLTDTLTFFEFNRGQTPTQLEVPALTTGRGVLVNADFLSDISWENTDVDLDASVDGNGRTRLEWYLGGFPGDITEFWDQVHAAGTAPGAQSLAQLMDPRTNKVGDPHPSVFPPTINPLEWLTQNVLRNNAYAVKIKTTTFGDTALGMEQARLFRKLVPPHTLMIILAELEIADDPIVLDGSLPTDTTPGYEETAEPFLGMEISETIPVTMVTESVKIKSITGRCQ